MMPPRDEETFDVVVVGSGFGGAVTAYRLAKSGAARRGPRTRPAVPAGSFARTPPQMRRAFWDPGARPAWALRALALQRSRHGRLERARRRVAHLRERDAREGREPSCARTSAPAAASTGRSAGATEKHYDNVRAMQAQRTVRCGALRLDQQDRRHQRGCRGDARAHRRAPRAGGALPAPPGGDRSRGAPVPGDNLHHRRRTTCCCAAKTATWAATSGRRTRSTTRT